jgi:hypothetical protein
LTESVADRAYRSLCDLRGRLPYLREMLEPGTPRRGPRPELTADQLARLGELARAERAEREGNAARGIKALGEGRAPLVLNVLDSEIHIIAGITLMEAQACAWLGLTPLKGNRPADRISRVIGLLGRLEHCEEWIGYVADDAGRLARRAARAMGDVEPVHTFHARCPVCSALSLRALPERSLIVCVNTSCRCLDQQCPCQRGRRHAWTFTDPTVTELPATA